MEKGAFNLAPVTQNTRSKSGKPNLENGALNLAPVTQNTRSEEKPTWRREH